MTRELQLSRPADSWPEKLFRFSLYYWLTGLALGGILYVSPRGSEFGKRGGILLEIGGLLYVVCFFYMLNYMVWRFAKNAGVRIAWWLLMMLVACVLGLLLLLKLR